MVCLASFFFWAVRCSTDTAWPNHAHHKGVFRTTFQEAHKQHGYRLRNVVLAKLDAGMKVDWKQWGCYVLLPTDKPTKTQVIHTPTKTIAELEEEVTNYEVRENWHELKAQIKIKRSWTDIVDYFEPSFKAQIVTNFRDNKLFLQTIATKAHNELLVGEVAPSKVGKGDGDDDEDSDGFAMPPAGGPKAATMSARRAS